MVKPSHPYKCWTCGSLFMNHRGCWDNGHAIMDLWDETHMAITNDGLMFRPVMRERTRRLIAQAQGA